MARTEVKNRKRKKHLEHEFVVYLNAHLKMYFSAMFCTIRRPAFTIWLSPFYISSCSLDFLWPIFIFLCDLSVTGDASFVISALEKFRPFFFFLCALTLGLHFFFSSLNPFSNTIGWCVCLCMLFNFILNALATFLNRNYKQFLAGLDILVPNSQLYEISVFFSSSSFVWLFIPRELFNLPPFSQWIMSGYTVFHFSILQMHYLYIS